MKFFFSVPGSFCKLGKGKRKTQVRRVKVIRAEDEEHARLTGIMGLLMAESGKPKTFLDALHALTTRAILLPEGMLNQIQSIIADKELGYFTPEEFVRATLPDKLEEISKRTWASKPDGKEH